MKKIVCEVCGSSNIVKKEGYFVCQDCGVKYEVSEVKKLLSECEEENTQIASDIEQESGLEVLCNRKKNIFEFVIGIVVYGVSALMFFTGLMILLFIDTETGGFLMGAPVLICILNTIDFVNVIRRNKHVGPAVTLNKKEKKLLVNDIYGKNYEILIKDLCKVTDTNGRKRKVKLYYWNSNFRSVVVLGLIDTTERIQELIKQSDEVK